MRGAGQSYASFVRPVGQQQLLGLFFDMHLVFKDKADLLVDFFFFFFLSGAFKNSRFPFGTLLEVHANAIFKDSSQNYKMLNGNILSNSEL